MSISDFDRQVKASVWLALRLERLNESITPSFANQTSDAPDGGISA
jgi:hypothetical protein